MPSCFVEEEEEGRSTRSSTRASYEALYMQECELRVVAQVSDPSRPLQGLLHHLSARPPACLSDPPPPHYTHTHTHTRAHTVHRPAGFSERADGAGPGEAGVPCAGSAGTSAPVCFVQPCSTGSCPPCLRSTSAPATSAPVRFVQPCSTCAGSAPLRAAFGCGHAPPV